MPLMNRPSLVNSTHTKVLTRGIRKGGGGVVSVVGLKQVVTVDKSKRMILEN